MLESLEDPTLPVFNGENAMGAGNQQGRPDRRGLEPSETVRRTLTNVR
jgi:hypothetical protein